MGGVPTNEGVYTFTVELIDYADRYPVFDDDEEEDPEQDRRAFKGFSIKVVGSPTAEGDEADVPAEETKTTDEAEAPEQPLRSAPRSR